MTAPPEPQPDSPACARCGACLLCCGSGPALSKVVSELFRQIGPSPEVRKHLDSAAVELLKALQVLLDQRIKAAEASAPSHSRGTSLSVD